MSLQCLCSATWIQEICSVWAKRARIGTTSQKTTPYGSLYIERDGTNQVRFVSFTHTTQGAERGRAVSNFDTSPCVHTESSVFRDTNVTFNGNKDEETLHGWRSWKNRYTTRGNWLVGHVLCQTTLAAHEEPILCLQLDQQKYITGNTISNSFLSIKMAEGKEEMCLYLWVYKVTIVVTC